MTKTKRNLILVVSLLFAIFTLCSVFAGVSFHTPQTVEATETLTDEQLQYRRDNPGLYETGTTTFVKDGDNDMTWKYLIDSKKIEVSNGRLDVSDSLAGDLICGGVSGLTSLYASFADCSKLTFVDANALDTKSVTDMDSMFYCCSSLKEVNLKGLNTTSVADMQYMFMGCSALEHLDVSSFNTSKVESFEGMFAGVHLKELDLSNFVFMDSIDGDAQNAMGMLGVNVNAGYWEFADGSSFFGVNLVELAREDKTEELASAIKWFNACDNQEGRNIDDLSEEYKSEIEGKDRKEREYIGMKYALMGWAYDYASGEWTYVRNMFDTKIEKIILPASAKDAGIWLPSNTTYVAGQNGETAELEQQILYGYKDLSMTSGAMLTAKTPDVENTGVKLDTKTIIIACAIAGGCVLAIVAVILSKVYKANKRKNGKF